MITIKLIIVVYQSYRNSLLIYTTINISKLQSLITKDHVFSSFFLMGIALL